MTVTASMIKELRERTGVGMSACKQALVEAEGNMEKAIELLRKKGMASAVKKESRDAKEGVIGYAESDDALVLVEVSAETDFVTQNQVFQDFLSGVAEELLISKPANLEDFLKQNYSKDGNMTIDEYRATAIQAVGENIQIRRFAFLPKDANSCVGIYRHMGGKIVAAVEIVGANDQADVAKEIAMHVAAAAPEYLDADSVPSDIIEKEKEIARSQIQNKPEHIQDKIIEGKLRAFYDQSCLVNQGFIKDDSVTVAQLLENKGKEAGKQLSLKGFTRWSVGA